MVADAAVTHDIDLEHSREEDEGFDADVTDGSVLKDHFIVSKRHYHMLEAKVNSLETSLDHAAALLDGAEKEADHQKMLAQQSQAGLKESTDRLAASAKKIGELEKSQGTLQSELEEATKEVDREKGVSKDWKDATHIAIRALAAEKQKVRDLEEREKAAVLKRTALEEDKAALEKENAALKAEVVAEKAKVEEVVSRGKRLFEGFSSK
jgi:chromosome segregation ATPase